MADYGWLTCSAVALLFQYHYLSQVVLKYSWYVILSGSFKSTKEAMDKILASEGTIILALLNIVFSFCLQTYLVHVNTFSEESLYAHTFSCAVNHSLPYCKYKLHVIPLETGKEQSFVFLVNKRKIYQVVISSLCLISICFSCFFSSGLTCLFRLSKLGMAQR